MVQACRLFIRQKTFATPPCPKGKFVENVMTIDDVGTMPYIVQNEY